MFFMSFDTAKCFFIQSWSLDILKWISLPFDCKQLKHINLAFLDISGVHFYCRNLDFGSDFYCNHWLMSTLVVYKYLND